MSASRHPLKELITWRLRGWPQPVRNALAVLTPGRHKQPGYGRVRPQRAPSAQKHACQGSLARNTRLRAAGRGFVRQLRSARDTWRISGLAQCQDLIAVKSDLRA
jgi:hypothetical protein